MAYNRVHGVNLVDSALIKNFKVEDLNSTPGFSTPGNLYYNNTSKDFRASYDSGIEHALVSENVFDQRVFGRDKKQSVRVATTGTVTLAEFPTEIDGVTLITGDRVLVKDANPATDNGIFVVGTIDTYAALTRALDADNSPEGEVTNGMLCFVNEGTINAKQGYILTTSGTITLGTTPLTFKPVAGASAANFASDGGLYQSGDTVAVRLDGSSIVASGLGLKIADGYIRTNIVDLDDTPNAIGSANTIFTVNGTTDGLVFTNQVTSVLALTDVPSTFGSIGNILAVNATQDGLEWIDNPTDNIQDELDDTQLGAGLSTTGSFVTLSGTNYINAATSINYALLLVDNGLESIRNAINNKQFVFTSGEANTTHTINHGFNTQLLDVSVYVYDTSDSKYHTQLTDVEIIDYNNFKVDFLTSENIKVVVRAASNIIIGE